MRIEEKMAKDKILPLAHTCTRRSFRGEDADIKKKRREEGEEKEKRKAENSLVALMKFHARDNSIQ